MFGRLVPPSLTKHFVSPNQLQPHFRDDIQLNLPIPVFQFVARAEPAVSIRTPIVGTLMSIPGHPWFAGVSQWLIK